MPHSKTPGGQAPSDAYLKKDAAGKDFARIIAGSATESNGAAKGLGASNAAGHTEGHAPGEAPVASDSGASRVGIDNSATNQPGEKGLKDVPVSTEATSNANMKN